MSNNNEITIKKKYLAIVLIAIAAISLIVPYQILAQNQTDTSSDATEPVNAPKISSAAPAQPLTNVVAMLSNNIMSTKAYYTIAFTVPLILDLDHPGSALQIGSVEITFPSGFNIANAEVVEVKGCEGTDSCVSMVFPVKVSGQTLILDLLSAAYFSAGQQMSITAIEIVNGNTLNNQIAVTTKDNDGNVISGPTLSAVFQFQRVTTEMLHNSAVTTIKLKDSNVMTDDIANGAVTASKVARSFMKFVQLKDDDAGHAAGWDPDGRHTTFTIEDHNSTVESIVQVSIEQPGTIFVHPPISIADVRAVTVNPVNAKLYASYNAGGFSEEFPLISVIEGTEITNARLPVEPPHAFPISPVAVNTETNMVYVAGFLNADQKYCLCVLDGTTDELVKAIKIDDRVFSVAVNPVTNMAYFTIESADKVLVVDGSTNEVVKSIDVADIPRAIALNPETNKIYVANPSVNRITVIDGTSNEVATTIDSIPFAFNLAINSETNTIYVTNASLEGGVSVIDGETDELIDTIEAGEAPEGIAVDEGSNLIFIGNVVSRDISVIDGSTHAVVTTIRLGGDRGALSANGQSLAFNAETDTLYGTQGNSIAVIELSQNIGEPLSPIFITACGVSDFTDGESFRMGCADALADGSILNYTIINPP